VTIQLVAERLTNESTAPIELATSLRALEKAAVSFEELMALADRTTERRFVLALREILTILKRHDRYLYEHSSHTWRWMEAVGIRLGLFQKVQRRSVRLGCLLHDAGKLCVDRRILNKPAALSDDEFELMKLHPAIGHELLSRISRDEVVLRIVRHHHERGDGSGYPDRLTADQIPDYVAAFTVCDCFDALTSDRPYRAALTDDEALDILQVDADRGKLDQAAVNAIREAAWMAALGLERRP